MVRRLPLSLLVLLAALAVCAQVSGDTSRPAPPAFLVIVNTHNQATALDRSFAEDAFLKKVTSWSDGTTIRPVDLPADSATRRSFTREVMNRSVEAVKGYWQQRIFSGRDVPPPELDTDEDVIRFVLQHEGGVGYVSGAAHPDGCKIVAVR